MLLSICSAFHWIDHLTFRNKVNKFVIEEPPLFIIGHWRSGTTYLHNILTQDPVSGYSTTYHSVFPNNLKSKLVFKTFMRIFMPNKRPGDGMLMSVNFPQEDEYALSNITHQSYYHFFYFPSSYSSLYSNYIRFESLSEKEIVDWKMKYKRFVIKALINSGGSRAILKNPVNTGRMLKLLEIFPEANFIYIVRNPVIVYLSTKKFFEQWFPLLNLEKFPLEGISELILEVYVKLMEDYFSDKESLNSNRITEVRFESLLENPMEEVRRIYDKFGFAGFQELKPVFHEYLDTIDSFKSDAYIMEKHELDRVLNKLGFAMKLWNYELPD
ncbi:MAG: sulfotransferase, partial [Bacteroidales bacterium]|nr:sulfotransferase [Bacteroidales bacterium]